MQTYIDVLQLISIVSLAIVIFLQQSINRHLWEEIDELQDEIILISRDVDTLIDDVYETGECELYENGDDA